MAHIVIDARIISSSTGRYVERLITHLQQVDTKNQYTILVREKDRDYWKPSAKNFSVRIADFANYSIPEQICLKKLLDEIKPDLVHFCMPQQPLGYKGKKVTTFHDLTLLKTYNSDKNWLMYHTKQKIGKYVFKQVAKDNDHIITVSNFTKDELQKLVSIPNNKVTTIYEASDVDSTTPERMKLPFKEFILYVGQQSDYKNIKRLGDAHQLLREKHPNLGLVLAGKKNAATAINEEYFTTSGYKDIYFTDFVSDRQLSWLYSSAKAYVFPSLMEGFGLPGLEAMSHNLPVVSSNFTCLPEVYGDAAHYFDPLDTEDIARAVDEVLSDISLQDTLTKNGEARLKHYSWLKMAKETHAIYKKVLKN